MTPTRLAIFQQGLREMKWAKAPRITRDRDETQTQVLWDRTGCHTRDVAEWTSLSVEAHVFIHYVHSFCYYKKKKKSHRRKKAETKYLKWRL